MALKSLGLRDFVLVEQVELNWQSGFTVLTGETGAGKSVLIDALQCVTGARADPSLVREGANRCEISAEFDCTPHVRAILERDGYDDDGDTLLLRRVVDKSGKSRGWINGSPATAQQLRSLGETLLDIYGQHAWQSLTRSDAVQGLLDAYAGVSCAPVTQIWQIWRRAQVAVTAARANQDTLLRDRERLDWQIQELEQLNPLAHEWETLQSEHSRLANAQALLDAAYEALQNLEDADLNASRLLNSALNRLESQQALECDFGAPLESLHTAVTFVEDATRALRSYLNRTEPDPQRLRVLDDRLAQWLSMARRHRVAPEDLPALLQRWRSELSNLNAAADMQGLIDAEDRAHTEYQAQASVLTDARQRAAPELARAITLAMQGLGMQGGRFLVEVRPSAQPQEHGLEDIDFLVSGHPGSTPRPIGKVASGGELSRIALAIAVTTSALGTAQTLIFDEVDAGVGGAVADTVGQLLQRLGVDRQVLAVTHLAQVAAHAHHHLVVTKHRSASKAVSEVAVVHDTLRLEEIARMLGGSASSVASIAHARELLKNAAPSGRN